MSSSQFNDNSSTSSFPIQNNVNSSGSASSLMTNNSLQHHNQLSMASNLSIVEAGLSIGDVADLLHPQYAIITGGRSREGCSLITFPDHNNFHTLGDSDYKKLILYLTSVPAYVNHSWNCFIVLKKCFIYRLHESDLGFNLIVDRRKDRWNSVKAVLLKISVITPYLYTKTRTTRYLILKS